MFNERNKRVDEAPPSTPVLVLGLNGAPHAGEKFTGLMKMKRKLKMQLTAAPRSCVSKAYQDQETHQHQ